VNIVVRAVAEDTATGGNACRTERAEGRRYADSAQPRSAGVPIESRRTAATGVTATAIVFMASSFDGCPRDADESPPAYPPSFRGCNQSFGALSS